MNIPFGTEDIIANNLEQSFKEFCSSSASTSFLQIPPKIDNLVSNLEQTFPRTQTCPSSASASFPQILPVTEQVMSHLKPTAVIDSVMSNSKQIGSPSTSLHQIIWCGLSLLLLVQEGVHGHGRLIEPPSRASAWRFGFDTPHNYNDHELYCGGFTRQWNRNGGKCGVCGDAWDAPKPRPHEVGGTFYKGVIVRKYAPRDVITVKVQLTASHMGHFEFRICDQPAATDEECMNKHVLKLEGSDKTKFYPKNGSTTYEMKYRLPDGLECTHCVFQWQYIAGNNWGTCADGTGAVGCGPQEEFRACADISIADNYTTTTRRPRPTYVPPNRKPTVPTPEESSGSSVYGIVIALVSLFLAVLVLAAIYLYYYRGGMRIKNFLKSKVPPPAPVPPPRHKRLSLSRENPPEISAPKLITDSGYETVDLRSK